jgi:hypothetical protein
MAGNSNGSFWFFVQRVRGWFLPDVDGLMLTAWRSLSDPGVSLGWLASIRSFSYVRQIHQLQKSQCMVQSSLPQSMPSHPPSGTMLTCLSFKSSSLRLRLRRDSLPMATRTFSTSPPVDVLLHPCTPSSHFAHVRIPYNFSIISAGKCTTSDTIHMMNSFSTLNSMRRRLPAFRIAYGRPW